MSRVGKYPVEVPAGVQVAIANGVFIVLVVTALTLPGSLPSPWAGLVLVLPSVALAHGLAVPSIVDVLVLSAWAGVGVLFASRRFRWDA